MAAFIEQVIFRSQQIFQHEYQLQEGKKMIRQLIKYINSNISFTSPKKYDHKLQHFLVLNLDQYEYIIHIFIDIKSNVMSVQVTHIKQNLYLKITSKDNINITIKEINRYQYDHSPQSTYYINNGAIIMTFKFYPILNSKSYADLFGKTIFNNLKIFHKFLRKKFTKALNQLQNLPKIYQQLMIASIVKTTNSFFDISQQKTQYKSVQQSQQSQAKIIGDIKKKIEMQGQLENLNSNLFKLLQKQITSSQILNRLSYSYQKLHLIGKNCYIMKKYQRSIEDFLFNIVKIQIKQKLSQPIATGGSCQIYLAKVLLTYINSLDFTSYKKKDQKVQKLIAIKTLKPSLQNQLKYKIIHQKNIINRLKGSCSIYLPKYYGTQKSSNLGDSLVMEHIHGQDLSAYIYYRSLTMSIWTKICCRHLNNNKIVHLDLKPINILVSRGLITKIIDYGEAYHKQVCPKDYRPGFTFPYVAPETFIECSNNHSINKIQYCQKQDVFALGIIMYEIFFNKSLFHLLPDSQHKIYRDKKISQHIFLNHQMLQSYGPINLVSALSNIFLACVDPQPKNRPTFDWIGVSLKIILNSYKSHQL